MAGNTWKLDIGAEVTGQGNTRFRVWAPRVRTVALRMISGKKTGTIPLDEEGDGFFSGIIEDVGDCDRYLYLLDGGPERPDPASRYQPEGVHGVSQVVDPKLFQWHDQGWTGIPIQEYVIYELHVGTFTDDGTFEAVIPLLGYLKELGITAVELMPVAQFPGDRNWGYDGVCPFAPHNSYGGPDGLKRLIDACHARGMAIILDVVYNHLGPEGNYLHGFGPYFTDRYRTPWGDAVNFDGPHSDPVRHYFISNALYWITEYHVDALRLDAIHAIYDFSALHILQELGEAAHRQGDALGRRIHVIAESDLNDVRVINPPASGGYGLDAQWNDDFNHALRSLMTGERTGYYSDFGLFSQLVRSFKEGFVLSGEYSAYRRRRHGCSSAGIPPGKLVVFSQNHDQVGNRMRGERLSEHISVQQLKLVAATVLLSPYVPLLFMGEEYGESAPFPFFVSHGDAELVESVRRGRLEEFAAFSHQGLPPDPQSEATFLSAKLDQEQRHRGEHRALFDFYLHLIRLRKECAPLARLSREDMQVVSCEEEKVLIVSRSVDNILALCLFNYSDQTRVLSPPLAGGTMYVLLDSTGSFPPGSTVTVYTTRPETFIKVAPFGVVVFRKEK